MEELKSLITQHATAWDAAYKSNSGLDWDLEQQLSDRVDALADELGVRLRGHVNPNIEN